MHLAVLAEHMPNTSLSHCDSSMSCLVVNSRMSSYGYPAHNILPSGSVIAEVTGIGD